MIWEGEERRKHAVGREVNRVLAVILIVTVALVVFTAAFVNGQRQADLLKVTCSTTRGHREQSLQTAENARILNDISRELGLPVEPIVISVPEVPTECMP